MQVLSTTIHRFTSYSIRLGGQYSIQKPTNIELLLRVSTSALVLLAALFLCELVTRWVTLVSVAVPARMQTKNQNCLHIHVFVKLIQMLPLGGELLLQSHQLLLLPLTHKAGLVGLLAVGERIAVHSNKEISLAIIPAAVTFSSSMDHPESPKNHKSHSSEIIHTLKQHLQTSEHQYRPQPCGRQRRRSYGECCCRQLV